MKILHISTAKSMRGGEVQVSYLLKGMDADQVLLCPVGAPLGDYSAHAIYYKARFPKVLFLAWMIARIVSKHDVKLIHAHDSKSHTALYMAYRLFGVQTPSIVTRRVDFGISNSSIKKYNHPLIKKIVAVSPRVLDSMQNSIKDQSRLMVIYSGIELSKSLASVHTIMRLPKERKIVAYVAAFTSEKRHDVFVETAEILLKQRKDVHFVLFGEGELKGEIKRMIAEKGLSPYFTTTGYVKNVSQYLDGVDVLLHTSEHEALGLGVLEAMHAGAIPVGYGDTGLSSYIVHGQNGFLVETFAAMHFAKMVDMALSDPARTRRLSFAAHESAQSFSYIHTIEQYEELYKNMSDL